MMWTNWTYKRKLKWLGIGALLLLLVCYRFSIARTVSERRVYREAKRSGSLAENMRSASMMGSRDRLLDKILQEYKLDTIDRTKNLLGIVSDYCDRSGTRLKEYKPGPVGGTDSLRVLTRSITLEGGFADCLGLVYQLETQPGAGRVSSVLFKSFEDAASDKTVLNCTILIQNIISAHETK